MRTLDWVVLIASLVFIIGYGVWKSRGQKNIREFLLADRSMRWWTVALSVMATQASAITFISTPGQAFVDGMRFVQFYFGLPLAMIILSMSAVPLYHKLNVFTAYEFLEQRFDLKTRALAAFLFLIQRGLAAGLTIYAPAIILSLLLGWDLYLTNLAIGGLVIVYTASGGSKAVSWTQVHQVIVIFVGMSAAFGVMVSMLPADVSFFDALTIAGKSGKLNAVDFSVDLDNRYSFWSGLIGGLFLQLSYFGTDQSQVGRYLGGQSVTQSRLGLLFNGIAKIPMQFIILFLGAFLYVIYFFVVPPLNFNSVEAEKIRSSKHAPAWEELETRYRGLHDEKQGEIRRLLNDPDASPYRLQEILHEEKRLRDEAGKLLVKNDPQASASDVNYIFLGFVLKFLPVGLVGLIIAAIFAASMSSTSAELNALASTSVVDVYKRMIRRNGSDGQYLWASRAATLFWGAFAVGFAEFANRMGSLIEAVNILGSLFYGTILGIFLVAFYIRRIGGTAVCIGAVVSELIVVGFFIFSSISYLWYNVIGCAGVAGIGYLVQAVINRQERKIQKN